MVFQSSQLKLIILLFLFQNYEQYKFVRRIQAAGAPYYKILMSLGTCKGRVLYTDQKIWGKIPLNRVLDIYYKSENPTQTVSRVEITLIINSTNSIAFSKIGVGKSEFSGTLYLPLNVGFIIYQLIIFTCSRNPILSYDEDEDQETEKYLPFIYNN